MSLSRRAFKPVYLLYYKLLFGRRFPGSERLARRVLAYPGYRLLVIDDASPDGTGELAEALKREWPGRVDVLHRPGKDGLGRAYVAGFRWALEREAWREVIWKAALVGGVVTATVSTGERPWGMRLTVPLPATPAWVGAAAPYFYEGRRGKFATLLERLALRARARKLGLWGRCPHTPYTPDRGISTGAS